MNKLIYKIMADYSILEKNAKCWGLVYYSRLIYNIIYIYAGCPDMRITTSLRGTDDVFNV